MDLRAFENMGLVPPAFAETARPDPKPAPRMLLVDDDPLFCRSVRHAAKKLGLDLTVCTTVGQVTSLQSGVPFDVAILDYFFGELTAFQLADLLDGEVPVLLVSNTSARQLSSDTWPGGIERFVHKNLGVDAILAEALFTARRSPAANGGLPLPVDPKPEPWRPESTWWMPFLAMLATGVCLGLLYAFLSSRQPQDRMWRWDRVPLQPSVRYSVEGRSEGERKEILCVYT
jgi:DNA-binding response OmpR family regulator